MSDRDPVSQSPLSQQGKSLAPVVVSARLGLRSNVADVERPLDAAKVLHNMQMHKKRYIWTPRGIGFTHLNGTVYDSGAKGLGFGRFVDSSGNLNLLGQYGTKLGSISTVDGTFTNIKTGLDATKRPCMRGYAPSTSTAQAITVYCNGHIEPRKITSTSAESALAFNAGVWPGSFAGKTYSKPKFCEPFGDRMIYAGFPDVDTQFDVLISDQGDAEDFTLSVPAVPTDAVALAGFPELGKLTAVKTFQPLGSNNEQIVIIGQKRGISIISGANASNYRIDILSDHHGIVNNNVIANILNDLIYLGTAGVFRFSSVALGNTFPQHADSRWVRDLIEQIDFDNADDAFCIHHSLTEEIHFYFPILNGSGTVKSGLIWNYNTDETEAGSLNGIWSTKAQFSIAAGIDFNNKFYGASYDGYLQKHYDGNTYNGAQIPFRYLSALVGPGNPAQMMRVKQVDVITEGADQRFICNMYGLEKRADGATIRTIAKPQSKLLEAPNVSNNSFPIGFPISFPSEHPKFLSYNPKLHARLAELEIQSSSSSGNALEFNSAEITLSNGGFIRK